MKTDKRVTEALQRISANEPLFMEWLQGRLTRHQDRMGNLKDEVEVRWAQGRWQEVNSIMKEFFEATEKP